MFLLCSVLILAKDSNIKNYKRNSEGDKFWNLCANIIKSKNLVRINKNLSNVSCSMIKSKVSFQAKTWQKRDEYCGINSELKKKKQLYISFKNLCTLQNTTSFYVYLLSTRYPETFESTCALFPTSWYTAVFLNFS